MPSFILIVQPFGHSARTSQTDRRTGQRSDSIGRTVLQTVAQRLILLGLTPPAEGFPWDDLCDIFIGCQWMAKVRNAVEIMPKISTA